MRLLSSHTTLRSALRTAGLCGATLLLAAGCDKKGDNTRVFTDTINIYYMAHWSCIWPESKRFPVQEETSDTAKTMGYDALVDQGLLVRTTAEKKKFIIGSKQVNNYDLTEKGRGAWSPDPNQPGAGNFCYGHRTIGTFDNATPTTDAVGATTQVTYHYFFSDVPAWASAAETQTAFPQITADMAGVRIGQATLTNTGRGWVFTGAPEPRTKPVDGTIVQ